MATCSFIYICVTRHLPTNFARCNRTISWRGSHAERHTGIRVSCRWDCIGFIVGSHNSTGLPAAFAATPVPQKHIAVSVAKPTVPGMAKTFRGDKFTEATLQLDGMEYVDTTFEGVTFTYSGGAYSFRNATFSLPLTVRLEGPAANTSGLVDLIRSLNSGNPRLSPSPGVPIVRQTGTKKTVRHVNFASPYWQ